MATTWRGRLLLLLALGDRSCAGAPGAHGVTERLQTERPCALVLMTHTWTPCVRERFHALACGAPARCAVGVLLDAQDGEAAVRQAASAVSSAADGFVVSYTTPGMARTLAALGYNQTSVRHYMGNSRMAKVAMVMWQARQRMAEVWFFEYDLVVSPDVGALLARFARPAGASRGLGAYAGDGLPPSAEFVLASSCGRRELPGTGPWDAPSVCSYCAEPNVTSVPICMTAVLRLSRGVAAALDAELRTGRGYAHHEIAVPLVCERMAAAGRSECVVRDVLRAGASGVVTWRGGARNPQGTVDAQALVRAACRRRSGTARGAGGRGRTGSSGNPRQHDDAVYSAAHSARFAVAAPASRTKPLLYHPLKCE